MKSIISTAVAFLAAIATAESWDVDVGKDGLVFTPDNIQAAVGDTITYHFYAKNHSVTQSSFKEPCKPLASGGFFSGFVPVPDPGTASATTFTITVNDTKPIWVYCGQTAGDHCQSGMVQAINAKDVDGGRLSDFRDLATKASKPSTSPPDGLPAGGLRLTTVKVGQDKDLVFSPADIQNSLPGEVIRFGFNPANHSVVQSSFDQPCKYLPGGFTSGFVPTTQAPSGVNFDVVVKDTKPIWFYCAQTGGGKNVHCNKGMVGSVNAPSQGTNTLDAFRQKAAGAGLSTIPDAAPQGGVLSVNGYTIADVGGNVLDITKLDPSMLSTIPPPGDKPSAYIIGMAGGAPPASYFWAPNITDTAVSALQFLQYVDNLLATILLEGHLRLTAASSTADSWAGAYPDSITSMFGSVAAQTVIHRRTSTDCLQHYSRSLVPTCTYNLTSTTASSEGGVDYFLSQVLTLSLLSVGSTIDALSKLAASDSWLIPALATQLGSKTRNLALVNLMQGHSPSAAPREVQLPMSLAYSYLVNHDYVSSCDGGEIDSLAGSWVRDGKTYPKMEVYDVRTTTTAADGGKERTVSLKVRGGGGGVEAAAAAGGQYVAWIGPWGGVEYVAIQEDGSVDVPADLYGHVWAVVTAGKGEDSKLSTMEEKVVAGPEMVWVSQP